jgi:MFS family permease
MAAYACVIATTAALGLSLPLLPLGIERAGYSSTMNGLSGVMGALALLVTAPFIPAWAARFGTVRLLIGCFLLAAGCMALFPLSPIPLWYVLRFLMNAALQGLFIISEIWINTLATEKTRGRLIGLYGALATAGFAAGPAIAALFADGSMIPFFLATGVILAGLVPVLAARDLTPQPEHTPMSGLTAALIAAPVAVLAAFFHAGAETAIASFLPVYAVREGWSGPNAILLMTVFGLGNVILQLPIGWLADKINR